MSNKHEREPWVLGGCSGRMVTTPSGYVGDGYIADVDTKDNARRIVACVNACRGLPTDELEQKGLVAAVGTQLLDVEQQRDGWQTALGTVLATIPDAEIIRASGTVGGAVAYFTQLHQQRDELLAALEGVLQWVAYGQPDDLNHLDRAHAAIRNAKGGAA